ncbi:MAG: sigma-E processing peptidase SpoIIGA, partial [Clostridia bacterium]|nr:sigma-E processing peptidase SpoIIGA [Clostridia bacterium]
MQVYIEDALLDTTVINFVILYLTVFSLKQKIVLVRLILSALLGSIFSLLLTLVSMSLFITLSLKLISGLIMVAISIN